MHTYLLGFAIILTVNTPNTLYSFFATPIVKNTFSFWKRQQIDWLSLLFFVVKRNVLR